MKALHQKSIYIKKKNIKLNPCYIILTLSLKQQQKSNIFEHLTCTLIYTLLIFRCWNHCRRCRRRRRCCCFYCLFLDCTCAFLLYFVFFSLLFWTAFFLTIHTLCNVRSILKINFADSTIRSVKSCTTFNKYNYRTLNTAKS